jgi:predicted protein tyrosine phosphatase
MKKIEFMSRGNMIKLLLKDNLKHFDGAIISISDTKQELQEMEIALCDFHGPYIALMFQDDDVAMNPVQANCLLDFINKNANKDFLVHCFAGVSRSGAIAKFINEHLEAGVWYLEDYKGHNRKVFEQLRAAAGTSLSAYYAELEENDRKINYE